MSLLSRYLSGEHEVVWRELIALGPEVRSAPILDDAWAVALETMRRVRHNVEILHQRLPQIGYIFQAPESALLPPNEEDKRLLAEVEKRIGPLPLSLRAFYEVVGSVNFCHYLHLYDAHLPKVPPSDVALRELSDYDPLSVDSAQCILESIPGLFKREKWTIEFDVVFAPDAIMKAGASGDAYYFHLPNPNADFQIGWGDEYFVEHLRFALRSGGFRGMPDWDEWDEDDPDSIGRLPPPAELVERLTADLLPI